FLRDQRRRLVMIAMRVADQKDLGVAVLKAKLLNALFDCRHVLFEIGVDQDVALRRVNQVDGEVGGTDVVQVAGNLEGREFAMPLRVALREQSHGSAEEGQEE